VCAALLFIEIVQSMVRVATRCCGLAAQIPLLRRILRGGRPAAGGVKRGKFCKIWVGRLTVAARRVFLNRYDVKHSAQLAEVGLN
jgi:hypothetical protein